LSLTVEKAALIMSIQDRGRRNFQRFGMPVSGPMDWWAFRCANQLVGNAPEFACVEMGFSSARITVGRDVLLAACGAGYRLLRNNREHPLWMAFFARKGDQFQFVKSSGGNWVYLAVASGIQSQVWMGSRSVYPRAGLGHLIADGDQLPLVNGHNPDRTLAGTSIPEEARPAYSNTPFVRVIPGPHTERFTKASQAVFWTNPFSISPRMDRMGYRLTGPVLSHKYGADIISQGLTIGQIQVPPDGGPIVMMADHPTTGGYTSIGTAIRADLPLFAQAEPGQSEIRFTPTTVADAQGSLITVCGQIGAVIDRQEESWTYI